MRCAPTKPPNMSGEHRRSGASDGGRGASARWDRVGNKKGKGQRGWNSDTRVSKTSTLRRGRRKWASGGRGAPG
jgi:hypothetical protein